MQLTNSRTTLAVAVCGAALLATTVRGVAQGCAGRSSGTTGWTCLRCGWRPRRRSGACAVHGRRHQQGWLDAREELKASFDAWFSSSDAARAGAVTQEQLATAITAVFPAPPAPPAKPGADCGGRSTNPQVACPPTSTR